MYVVVILSSSDEPLEVRGPFDSQKEANKCLHARLKAIMDSYNADPEWTDWSAPGPMYQQESVGEIWEHFPSPQDGPGDIIKGWAVEIKEGDTI